jgi:hypothetical protein
MYLHLLRRDFYILTNNFLSLPHPHPLSTIYRIYYVYLYVF